MIDNLTKRNIAMRAWLMGKGYHMAFRAMEFARPFHQGLRKDEKTPEFEHQISIACYVKSLHDNLLYPEETLAAVFLHDTAEDTDVGFPEITAKFGRRVSDAVRLLTKKHRGNVLPIETYYSSMSTCPIASIVKGADRIHNIQSMQEAFALKKQQTYCTETVALVLPMLKNARLLFPEQEPSYQNIKLVLNNQLELLDALHQEKKENEDTAV